MANEINQQMTHFNNVYKEEIIDSSEAILAGDTSRFRKIINDLKDSDIVKHIANMVNSCSRHLHEFMATLEEKSPGFKALFGGVLGGVGGAVLSDIVGLAGALGISVISAEVIGIVLVVAGICIALPAIWQLATTRLNRMMADLTGSENG